MTRVSSRHRRVPHAYRAPPPPPPPAYSTLPSLPSLPALPALELDLPSDSDTSRSSLSDESPARRSADSSHTGDTDSADESKATAYRAFLADGISSGQYTRSECLRELKRLVLELESACKKVSRGACSDIARSVRADGYLQRGTLPGDSGATAAVKARRRLTTVDE